MEDQILTVVYASDRNLYPYLPITINSLLRNNPVCKVYIFCEDDKIDCINDPRIEFINVEKYCKFLENGNPHEKYYLSYMTFTRLWIADILKEDKILWLDVDTVIDGPLDELWNTDLTNKIVAGSIDGQIFHKDISNTLYINAGVLLMNLKMWRQYGLTDKSKKLLASKKFKYGDQDIINIICSHFIVYLDSKWNFCPNGCVLGTSLKPIIYHYAGQPKIWNNISVILWLLYYTDKIEPKEV